MRSFFLAPHPDDETLFGAFTLLRQRPVVVVCLDCGSERTAESTKACAILGCEVVQWDEPEGNPDWDAVASLVESLDADQVFAPAHTDDGNADHNRIAALAPATAGRYLTYSTAGKTTGREVPYEPHWIGLKHQALACYASQFRSPGRAEHFLRDIREFAA